MQGPPTPAFGQVFYPTSPLPLTVRIPLSNGCTVVVARLDSDADVAAFGLRRFAARGSFVSQCDKLREELSVRPVDELRVLLLHHSSIVRGVPSYLLRITRQSYRELVKLIRNCGIAIVLTGHHHWPDWARPVSRPEVVEARCGTTTSRDFFNDTRDTGGILCHNSLLVHRLFQEGRGIVWKAEVQSRREPEDPFRAVDEIDFGMLWSR
jgi:hypothetical protein